MRTPVKFAARINDRVLPEATPPERSFEYIDIGAVGRDGLVARPAELTEFGEAPSRARRLADPGATVISTVRTYLRAIAYVDAQLASAAVFSTGFAVLEPLPNFDSRFFHYACRSDSFVEEVVARSVGVSYPAIAPSDLGDITIPTPSLDTQRKIADYLDDQCARIDEVLMLRREQMLAAETRFLTELRLGVMNESVPEVPLRRFLRNIQTGSTPTIPEDDGSEGPTIPWYTPDSFGVLGRLLAPRKHFPAAAGRESKVVRFPADSVLLVGIGWASGRVAYLDHEAAGNQQLTALSPNQRMRARYLLWQMHYLAERVRKTAPYTVLPVLSNDFLLSVPLRVPRLPEQDEIVSRLDEKAHLLGECQREMAEQTELLLERKRSLITSSVSGEFDVSTASGRGI